MWRALIRVGRLILVIVVAQVMTSTGQAQSEPPQRSTCLRDGATRHVELRMAMGVEGACDLIVQYLEDDTEERTLHFENSQGFCRARFVDRVRALRDEGWRCVDDESVHADRPETARSPDAPTPVSAPFAFRYRGRCLTALQSRYADATTICDCAVRTMNDAGFTERDYELLAAPYGDGERELPVHAAGLLYGLGAIAVDALERCGTQP